MKNWINTNKTFIKDAAERVSWTFVQAFTAVWLAPVAADILNGEAATLGSIWGALADTSVLDKAAVGGIAAVIAVGKSLFARRIGNRNSASTLSDVSVGGGV
jgi:hypothetical protein